MRRSSEYFLTRGEMDRLKVKQVAAVLTGKPLLLIDQGYHCPPDKYPPLKMPVARDTLFVPSWYSAKCPECDGWFDWTWEAKVSEEQIWHRGARG